MLHIFPIQSPLGVKIAETVIRKRELKLENVLFIRRNESAKVYDFNYVCLYSDLNWKRINYANKINFLISLFRLRLFTLKRFKQKFLKATKYKDFEFYAPHLISDDLKLISKFENCRKLNIIEEGDAVYRCDRFSSPLDRKEFYDDKFLERCMVLLGVKNSLNLGYLYPEEHAIENIYTFNSLAFEFYTRNKIRLLNREELNGEINDDITYRNYRKKKQFIILIDAFYLEGKIKKDEYIDFITQSLKKIKKIGPVDLSLSFHPSIRHDKVLMQNFIELCNKLSFPRVEIEDNVETKFFTCRGGVLVGTISSSMTWAQYYGWEVYSGLHYFPIFEKELSKLINIKRYKEEVNLKKIEDLK